MPISRRASVSLRVGRRRCRRRRAAPRRPARPTGIISCIRLRIRRNVDLPQPDGPISDVTWPAGMSSDTRSSTLWVPNHAEMFRASMPVSSLGRGSPRPWQHRRRLVGRRSTGIGSITLMTTRRIHRRVPASVPTPATRRRRGSCDAVDARRVVSPGPAGRSAAARRDRSTRRLPRAASTRSWRDRAGALRATPAASGTRSTRSSGTDTPKSAMPGTTRIVHGSSAPWITAVRSSTHPRPVEVAVDRFDLRRRHLDGGVVERCDQRARPSAGHRRRAGRRTNRGTTTTSPAAPVALDQVGDGSRDGRGVSSAVIGDWGAIGRPHRRSRGRRGAAAGGTRSRPGRGPSGATPTRRRATSRISTWSQSASAHSVEVSMPMNCSEAGSVAEVTRRVGSDDRLAGHLGIDPQHTVGQVGPPVGRRQQQARRPRLLGEPEPDRPHDAPRSPRTRTHPDRSLR